MQTHKPANSDQPQKMAQPKSDEQSFQLAIDSAPSFVNSRTQTAQLASIQSIARQSPQQQRLLTLQAKMTSAYSAPSFFQESQSGLKSSQMPNNSASVVLVQRLAKKHGMTEAKLKQAAGYSVYGWGRLIANDGSFVELTPSKAESGQHAEDFLMEEAYAILELDPDGYSGLQIWVTSSPCSTTFGTSDKDEGCHEELNEIPLQYPISLDVFASKAYQPRGVIGGKKASVDAMTSGSNINYAVDNKSGVAKTLKLQKYTVPADLLPLGNTVIQLAAQASSESKSQVVTSNNTGLPDNLKSGIESLSGYSMDDVKVHFNSDKPAQLNAHAYAQGTDIHVAPGQEQHLPHEAWHVVQQKQGRVQPTMQMKAGVPVNDDAGLENEADVMGAKALQLKSDAVTQVKAGATKSQTAQLNKTGAGVGALIGGGIGALGFLAGPVVGAITTTAGAAIGGMIGHHLTQPEEESESQDFGKFPANENIQPDQLGEENNGIRMLEQEQARPDDVPLMQNYRLAMHKLHNVILVLENADRSPEKNQSPDTAKLRDKMVSVQKKAKDYAKNYKAAMRNLASNETEDNLKAIYVNGMDQLAQELANHTSEGENVIKKQGYLDGKGTLEEEGTDLWRTQWLKTKRAVDTALTSLWKGWRSTLKSVARTNKGDASPNTPQNQRNWEQRVNSESWEIFYGGSLMKGYKGPPKQNTRFLASNFDVDANMDAPAVAEFLINEKGKTVDRGQLDPRGSGTRIEDMDSAMDTEVKKELVNSGVVPDAETANKIVSEEFETRVNAPDTLGDAAKVEVIRSSEEQRVRDKLTAVRKSHPEKMTGIGNELVVAGLFKDNSLDTRPLTTPEIVRVETIIDAA